MNNKVETTQKTVKQYSGRFFIYLNILFVSLAYFVYGESFDLTVAFLAVMILYDFATYLSFIPIIGIFFQGLLMYFLFTPFIETLTGLYNSWLLNLIFWLDIAVGGFISILMGFVFLIALVK